MNRKHDIKLYDLLYTIDTSTDGLLCQYCGQPSECFDHEPPISIVDNMNIEAYKNDNGKFLLISSCKSCNSRISNKRFINRREKLMHLYNRYEKMYKSKPVWTDKELNELGVTLRTTIKYFNQKQDILNDKLTILERNIRVADSKDMYYDDTKYIESPINIKESKVINAVNRIRIRNHKHKSITLF